MQVAFNPRILVAADDDTGAVGVEKEDVRGGRRLREEVVLEGEVVVGIRARGDVDEVRGICIFEIEER